MCARAEPCDNEIYTYAKRLSGGWEGLHMRTHHELVADNHELQHLGPARDDLGHAKCLHDMRKGAHASKLMKNLGNRGL